MNLIVVHLSKLAICYLLISFCFGFTNCSLDHTPLLNNDSTTQSHLDQINSTQDLSEKLILSPFLNPGEILGYFSPGILQDSYSINLVISKDGNIIFCLFNFHLFVYNITNPAKPQQVGSLLHIAGTSVSMLLSPDEKTLYLFGNDRLRVINVTNLASPIEIGYRDIVLESSDEPFYSQVISSDGKTLYTVNNECFNVWDVSDPTYPSFLDEKKGNYAGGIAISKSNTKLAVGLKKKFQIYNIEDLDDIKLVGKKTTTGDVYSMAFSDDEKRLFLGSDKSETVIEPNLEIYNITNLKSASLLVSARLADEASAGRLWFHSNEEYAFFTTPYEFKMVRIQDFQQITLFSSSTKTFTVPFSATPGNKINVVYASDNIIMMKFNIDVVPPSFVHFNPFEVEGKIFIFFYGFIQSGQCDLHRGTVPLRVKPNALKVIDEVDYNRRPTMAVSKEGKNIFLVRNGRRDIASMIPYQQASSLFQKLNPVSNLIPSIGRDFDVDANWDLIVGKNIVLATYVHELGSRIYVIDITNKNASYELTNFNYDTLQSPFCRIPAVALTGNDQKIIFINETIKRRTGEKVQSLTLNILTLENKKLKDTLRDFMMPYSLCSLFSVMKTSQNDKTLFYANCDLLIYNIGDPSSPTLESQYNLSVSRTYGLTLSKDQRILYLFGLAWNGVSRLQIFNISDIKTPKLLSRVEIPLVSEGTNLTEISSDGKTLLLGFKDGVLKVDVRVPSSPILFGFYYFLQKMDAENFVNNSIFYALSPSGVTAFDISSEYILHIKDPQLKIGGSYLRALNVLKLNKNFKFDFMIKKHKFIKVSIFDNSISLNAESSLKTLPNWITFDQERSLLKIEPNSPSHNGTFKISVTLTTQTEPSAFVGLESIPGDSEANELMLILIQSGYIDNQGYVSGDLDLNKKIWISPKYQNLEKDIRAILSENYIQAIGEIFVSSSLSLSETKPLAISSLSRNTIHATIQFDQKIHKGPRFVNKAFSSLKPTIVNSKSLVLLEGPLENINESLKEIVIDLDGVCDGEITINDGINPLLSLRIPSLSNYLHINDEPQNNLQSLQNQIDSNPFYTGLYSAMIINSSTFTDKNNLTLDYSLELEDSKLGLPPDWITLKGLSLMATPPESYRKFSYKFVLRISNEFQHITVPFTLKVKISFYYAAKLAFTFLGYTVSLIGFVYSMNKGYNILARKYYRHPRSFKLKVGEEINDSKIFSVSFINNEMGKIKNIFKALEKFVAQNHQMSLVEYFVDSQSQVLDKEKIMKTLKSLENEDYKQADSFSQRILQQLVINKIVMKQLAAKQGASTRDIFNKIKNKWMDLVIVSLSSPSQFEINSENLAEELSRFSLGYGGESLDETHFESSDLLIKKNKLNMDLLANAILSYAFDFQNIGVDLILIDVISYKRIRGKTLYHLIKRFLLKNLKPFVFLNKREIGCGIEYKTEDNTLHFFGKLTHELKNGTIVIHLKNHRGRILREFWITGENTEIQLQNYLHNNDSETL